MRTQASKRPAERLLTGTLVTILLLSSLLAAQAKSQSPLTRPLIQPPQLITPPNFAHTTGNPADPMIAGRLLYEPLGIPTFEWEDVGASRYKLEVATSPDFGESDVILRLGAGFQPLEYTTYTPNGEGETVPGFSLTEDAGTGEFTDEAIFYWRVQAWDDDLAEWSAPSSYRQFTRHWGYRPTLQWPEQLSTQDKMPYFAWDPVPGASFYQIQVDTSNSFGSPLINERTDVPVYTPVDTLANDDDLFWRVRAFHRPNSFDPNGGYGGPWSEVRQFKLAWSSNIGGEDKRPLLLTPPDSANYINRPLYCWQPVAGAKKYEIDVATQSQFVAGSFIVENKFTEGTCYAFDKDQTNDLDLDTTYYWRVTAYDAAGFQGYPGQSTDVGGAPFQFRVAPSETPIVPTLLYPPYYYPQIMPDTFEDRTMELPTFVWDHVPDATSYELCLDDDQVMDCESPSAIVASTANASFTFTDTSSYPLSDNQVYYWKVRADVPGAPDWNTMNNKWKTLIDTSRVAVTDTIRLIQPTYQVEGWTDGFKYGRESLTYYPVLGWTAVAPIGNATYQVQIAYDSDFEASDIVHDAETDFNEYTPTERPEPGSYFWRVRQVAPSTGDWSATGRFIVSRNFTFVEPDEGSGAELTVDGNPVDWATAGVPFYAGAGENGDASGVYDLSGFYVANSSDDWYLGVPLSDTVKLGLYFDSDHLDNSGADAPPSGEGDDPNPPLAHQPEYAIYWESESNNRVYQWNGSSWTYRGQLSSILASAAYSTTTEFLELKIPVTQLSTFYHKGSLGVLLYSLEGDTVRDRLPNLPGKPTEPAFLTESTVPTPLFPTNAPSDPSLATVEHNTPVLTWRHNEEGYSAFFFKTYQDDTLTNLYESENGNSPKGGLFWDSYTHWPPQVHYSDNNSYNWTIKRAAFPESAPNHFRKAGYIPTDLQFSPKVVSGTITYTNRTPSFSWQPAQSAPEYFWELFKGGQRIEYKETKLPYYTPQYAIADSTYTWKVWARDARNRDTAQAAQGKFTKDSGIVPIRAVEFTSRTLVLEWEPVDYAAYYKVEIADDSQFSRYFKSYETYNTSFTPMGMPQAAENGAFYWRVYLYDNRGNPGPYEDLNIDVYPEKAYLPMVTVIW